VSTIDRIAASADLHSGNRMTREEFHRIYEQAPEEVKAELIGGIVYTASPLNHSHGSNHLALGALFWIYQSQTPGLDCGDNSTILLGDDSEPQPDLYLRVLPEYGGQSGTTEDDYVLGAPEVLAEIADSSYSIDLHGKREDYGRHGVREYLVLNPREQRLHWFDLATDTELPPDDDGIVRLREMPGLWIHVEALLKQDSTRLMETLQAGLASPEHAAFATKLTASSGE
jgi:Uma2 family endonuclease